MNKKHIQSLTLTLLVSLPFSAIQADNRYWSTTTCGSGAWDTDCWNGISDTTAPDGSGAPKVNDDAYLYNHLATDYVVTYSDVSPSLGLLHIAGYGSGDMKLEINNGGYLRDRYGYLGYESGSHGTAVVNGAGSSWINNDDLYVGRYGAGSLNVINGGSVFSKYGRLGYLGDGQGTANIDGIGSSWTNSQSLYVGYNGTGAVNITNGGVVSNAAGYLGGNAGASGTAIIDGIGSGWSNSDELVVGSQGMGSLSITNGGSVSNTQGGIAYVSGSSGTVAVDGVGSSWTNSRLYVGGNSSYAGGTGELNIQNGGLVDVANTMKVWGSGTVNLSGGSLNADTIDITATGAEFNFTGGRLAVNTFNGDLVNQGGTLAPGNSPGLTTINGNYSQDINSTLEIEIGGLVAGSEYDTLDVTGIATLAGILDVDLYDLGAGMFEVSEGDTFDIVTAETINGEFDFLSLVSLGSGLTWQIDYLIDEIGSTDVVRLSAISAVPVPESMWLFGSGLIGLTVFSGRKKTRRS